VNRSAFTGVLQVISIGYISSPLGDRPLPLTSGPQWHSQQRPLAASIRFITVNRPAACAIQRHAHFTSSTEQAMDGRSLRKSPGIKMRNAVIQNGPHSQLGRLCQAVILSAVVSFQLAVAGLPRPLPFCNEIPVSAPLPKKWREDGPDALAVYPVGACVLHSMHKRYNSLWRLNLSQFSLYLLQNLPPSPYSRVITHTSGDPHSYSHQCSVQRTALTK
jgi:hypothetical protein